MSKVSIVITTYNLEQYIAQAIDSVLMQDVNFDYEIIVGDDASADNTQSILKSYQQKYPDKIKLFLSDKNLGSLVNSNRLFDVAKSEYISFLDGDDYWLDKSRLQKQVDFLDKNLEYTICAGNTMYLKNDIIDKKIISEKYLDKTYSFADYFSRECPFAHTSSVLLRNVVYHNGVPQAYKDAQKTIDNLVYRGEDIRFIHHFQKGKMFVFKDVFSVYRIHNQGLWSGASNIKKDLETCISKLKHITLFPEYKEIITIRFVDNYNHLLRKMPEYLKEYQLSLKEHVLLVEFLNILNKSRIDWDIAQKSHLKTKRKNKLRDIIYIKLYKILKKKLLKKGLI